ncbi:hypothetical protein VOLCADRAFT_98000 [Volvox carteri f. nagariensis]|uniref:ATP-dependent RNA helicase n=1 Tax=Volvox carteri f. nagariensis TaxID=3068 RepID=D8UE69_VOLCA|nr:uncharacterized protein VOLCADRAFT_98000 [Volvox carteri f. nagariensis]EFJ41914.1 hypothetical protein VOLCADRAFT_98000 [Volvox carteri f. nagariensis]|eukprot:XP_002956951.1 hypothetical protein VOLCADRAFT_98000 [Volvox carteri f. nagariensis]
MSTCPLAAQLGLVPTRGFAAAAKKRINKLPRLEAVAVAAETSSSGDTTFYSDTQQSFAELEVSPVLQEALAASGFSRPSKIQELTAPHILRGRNVVITAETGSGKTLSYVIPIAHLMLKQRAALERHQQQQLQEPQPQQNLPDTAPTDPAPRDRSSATPRRYHALVLCPNAALCQQVVATVNGLQGPDGEQLLTAAHINSSNPPPFDAPDVIVATPAGLLTIINDAGGAYGWLWSEEGMQARVRHVVVDEADLLLGNAYIKATERILTLFKVADRRRVEAKILEELGLADKSDFDRLPRAIKVAGWQGGVPAMLAEGYRPKRALNPEAKYGPYWRRQYILSAATMPTITYSDVGSQIQKMYSDAVWVSTELLHVSKPQVAHAWREVSEESFGVTLLDVVRSDPDYQARRGKTLIFAADGASADAVSELLHGGQVPHVVYHKSRPKPEQSAALQALRQQDGTVMVCTDAAARGLDVQGITHVVQADFAPNTIDFLHRIGRTARAGNSGRATSLYREHNRALVEVIRKYIAEGIPLEAAFSRARSFRRKLKRMGGVFVPRGMSASSVQGGQQSAAAGEGVTGTSASETEAADAAVGEVAAEGGGDESAAGAADRRLFAGR